MSWKVPHSVLRGPRAAIIRWRSQEMAEAAEFLRLSRQVEAGVVANKALGFRETKHGHKVWIGDGND